MSGAGQQFQIEAEVEEGTAVGVMRDGQAGVYFEAELDGAQLHVMLMDLGPDNVPDYTKAREILFRRAGAAVASPAAPPAPGVGAAAARGGRGLLGQWSCQTSDGPAQLNFVSDRQLVFNGETSDYTLLPGIVRVAGEWGPIDYSYELNGDALAVRGPDGSSMQCRRQTGGAGAAAGPGPGGAGTGMERLLQGRICAYSSSADGGYATTRILSFDGQGNFTTGGETYFNVERGTGASASRGAAMGRYVVTGNQKGAVIQLTFPDGSRGVAYVFHVDGQGSIQEIQFNGQLYGAGLCP
jgi:hypothetical protein